LPGNDCCTRFTKWSSLPDGWGALHVS